MDTGTGNVSHYFKERGILYQALERSFEPPFESLRATLELSRLNFQSTIYNLKFPLSFA